MAIPAAATPPDGVGIERIEAAERRQRHGTAFGSLGIDIVEMREILPIFRFSIHRETVAPVFIGGPGGMGQAEDGEKYG